MLFNSIEFVVFLPIVFLLYWYIFNKDNKSQNVLLLLASYVFYAFADIRFLALIAYTTVCTYYSALAIKHFRESGEEKKSKAMSALNIVANLAVLGFFKYYNFFVSSFAGLIPGCNYDNLMLNIAIPFGISYYTFTSLSYSIDVYLGKTKASKDIIQVAAYISFFPQLLAGPIGRSTYLLPQYAKKRIFNYELGVDGLRQILWGLFKKVVVADKCAVYVNEVWSNIGQYSSLELFVAIILLAFQVYGDFSGYSDIAIGVAKLFGIRIKPNFRFPQFSTNIADFWSRWHISLTGWLRDYVYAPLGGVWSKATIIRNIIIVFALCGLWHGASWNYVIWGLYNALLFVPYVLSFRYKKRRDNIRQESVIMKTKKIFILALTDIALLLGLLIFRSESLVQVLDYLQGLCSLGSIRVSMANLFSSHVYKRILVVLLLLVVEWLNRDEEYGLARITKIHSPLIRYCIYYLLALLIIVFANQANEFVYFQF